MKKKYSKKTENYIVLSFFVISMILASIINSQINVKEGQALIDAANNSFRTINEKQEGITEDYVRDIYSISVMLGEISDVSQFQKIVDMYSEKLNDVECVALTRYGEIEEMYSSNNDDTYNQKLKTIISKEPISSYSYNYNAEVNYIEVEDEKIYELGRCPVYISSNGNKSYYGEVVYLSNLEKRVTLEMTSQENLNSAMPNSEIPYKLCIKFDGENEYVVYDNKMLNEKNTVELTSKGNIGITYIAHVDKKMIEEMFPYSYKRTLVALVIIFVVSIAIKLILVLFRKQQELNNLNENKIDFFTNVIYEVRTSTNSIMALCDEVEKENEDSISITKHVDEAKYELKKLLHKIDNMLDITNVKLDKVKYSEEEYYLYILIDELTRKYESDVKKLEIDWIVDLAENLPIKFKGAKLTIQKILEHIISCSLKLIIDGRIRIRVEGAYTDNQETDYKLKFIISDTSIGINNDTIEEILESSNLSAKSVRVREEAEIELSIAKEIIRTLGGELKITSEFGKGSIYTVTITQNVVDKRIMNEDLLKSIEEKYRRNLGTLIEVNANVLVVDDNEVNLNALANMIKAYGANVDIAKSGDLAISMASEKMYDILYIDHLMPGIDGIETLKTIRAKSRKYRNVPAVLVTANVQANEVTYKNVGFDYYLAKPIGNAEIERSLKQLLRIELINCKVEID